MKRVILLKTQLAEAAKLAGSPDFAKQRLAVILLDNFMEIQLVEFMKANFAHDDWFTSRPLKYNFDQRKKILYNYNDLLKACVLEGIIDADERNLLAFCHDVRNNLYHQAREEPLLTFIALLFLNDLILKYQPQWKSARDFTSWDTITVDPYEVDTGKDYFFHDFNSRDAWELFLETHFKSFIDRSKTPSVLIAEHLLGKITQSRDHYSFLIDNHPAFHANSETWELNEYLMFYSFYNVKEFELKVLKSSDQKHNFRQIRDNMVLDYQKNWVYVKTTRLDTLEGHFKKIANLPAAQALKKFMAFRAEITMIHEALSRAASDLDHEIDMAIDYAKEQSRE
ncbi:hypothetical protein DBR40_07135 [Pedobacter sp. KBW01]|uniref:hypothetical protein n=1 Tax=Pedobacter sp. KBW01 TaxID=2153364 RepID=UPI000F5B3D87|nr:hypothetical protein [Pedobacter sp. KBW01]RQO77741.1 hypothetical protein DBR40_07135 [Pedobacter sp. KBW01]